MGNQAPAFGTRAAGFARLIVLATLVAACSGLPAPSVPVPAQSTQPAATPSAAAPGIRFMVRASGPQLAAYQALVTLFQQRHPGEIVHLVGIPDELDFQRRLAADVAAGSPADVLVERYTDVPGLASNGLLDPAAPRLAASHSLKLADFASNVYSPFISGHQLQCVPFSASGLVIYYNKDLFQKAGLSAPVGRWTKQEFVADARALTRDTNGDGQPDQYGLGLEPSLLNLAPFIWQFKGVLVDDETWPTELEMTTAEVVSATTWLVSLQTQEHVVPDQPAEMAAASKQRFQDGSLAMLIDTAASVPAYRQSATFDWDVAPLPTNSAGPSNVVVADGLCLAAASTHKDLAWQFIEFAASTEGQTLLAQAGAIVPARTRVAHSAAFLNPAVRPAHSQVFLDTLNYGLALPKAENWTDIQAIADEELQQAFYGQKDIGQALQAVTTRSEEYFKIHIAH